MSYYNLVKENFKFFSDNLKINSNESIKDRLEGGKKEMKYNVIDFDWDDIVFNDEDDIFLSSTSKELLQEKIKEPPKEEVYDEILNDKKIKRKFTGDLNQIDDVENISEDILEETISDQLTSEAQNDIDNEFENNLDEIINDDPDSEENSDSEEQNIINNYFTDQKNTDLAEIDDIIQNYFECFENFQGGQNINKIKDILSDETDYKHSLTLTGGNFKPIVKKNINKLYPYSLN